MWPILFFLKELLLCDVSHIELFTRKILNVLVEWICPDGIIPDSGLSGLNNIYIYIYIYFFKKNKIGHIIILMWPILFFLKELLLCDVSYWALYQENFKCSSGMNLSWRNYSRLRFIWTE